ncbi:unnamed protein product [Acanthoscelides obtectus]|uniref:Telomere-associated protein RIF1 n=1 Tax=Acanthoscelides obtectus TaxID=200917 RepID=A0A9P0PLC2_ACAOB|nr:unnamed protein product [Acanthoscelides obtectus]CAK1626934.1 Telomere-associated protein RIF1 [Acanthoscelides obtectus]
MNQTARLQFYNDVRAKMEKCIASKQTLETPSIIKCLQLIKDDIRDSNQATKSAAVDMLVFLMGVKTAEVQTEIMKFIQESPDDEVLQSFVNSLETVVLNTIVGGHNFIETLQAAMPYKEKIPAVVEKICKTNIPPEKCKELFLHTIIPSMMTENTIDADFRTVLVETAFRFTTIMPITNLTTDEVDTFLKNLSSKYVVVITNLRDNEYSNWHKLWMFLVRFCGKKLHNSMDLTNKLLRVVEFAFRNVNYMQRLRGYDCWKELIDNASLDKSYITSNKQMKLLITPLKAKFSKQDVVICKRFVVFCYLLDKLQEKAVVCLKEFLEFCFGPVLMPADSSKVGPVKSVSSLWLKSARALIDILGHYHSKEDCISIEPVIHLPKPPVNSANFPNFCNIILNSVLECCILLKGIEDAGEREKVIKCMWGTVFYLAAMSDDKNCFEYISQILESIVKRSNDDVYFQKILVLISSAFATESKTSTKLMEKFVQPMWKVLFNAENIPSNISDTFKHCITIIFTNTTTVEEKIKIVKDVMREIVTVQISDKNVHTVNKIWICVAKEITDDCNVDKMKEFDDFNHFFLWPAYCIHYLEESEKRQTLLLWMKLYKKVTQDLGNKKVEIFKDLEKIFKNNPLLASNVTSLVNIMSQVDTKHSNVFVCKLLDLVSQMLELPNLKNEDEVKLISLMLHYLNPNSESYADQSGCNEVTTKMCSCIKQALCLHQAYKILEPLGKLLKNVSQNVKAQFSKNLNELFADLYKKQSDTTCYAAKELLKVMVIFEVGEEKEKKVFVVPSGRSARIANLAKNSPKSPRKSNKASPVSLKLFGKDIDTLSPLKVKGSQLNNSTPPRTKKAANVIASKVRTPSSLDEESASKFVTIESEVKFQPSKLSEHQKEVLKRRRDDIPALYQDLSQSQSQDFSSSKSNSNDALQEIKERRSSRDVIDVIEELNEFVQVRTSFEEDKKQIEEAKDTQKSEDLFGETQGTIQVSKGKVEEKSVLSESLFSEEIKEENESKTSQMTALQIEQTPRTKSETSSAKVEETETKESETPLKTEETSSKASEVPAPIIEDTSSKPSEPPSKIGDTEAKPSEMTTEDTSSKASESTESKAKAETAEEKKKKKIAAELAKLQMNIVGADEYFASPRKRRAKLKKKDEEEKVDKKRGRKSLGAQPNEKTAENTRRKTIESTSSSSENDTPKKTEDKIEKRLPADEKVVVPIEKSSTADKQIIPDSNVAEPEKNSKRDSNIASSTTPESKCSKPRKSMESPSSEEQTVPNKTDQKPARSPRKKSKTPDIELSNVAEQTGSEKLGISPKKETKSESESVESDTRLNKRARPRRKTIETPEKQKIVPVSSESDKKDDESNTKMAHKRDLSRQLVNIGNQAESINSIIKDLKPSKENVAIIEEGVLNSADTGKEAMMDTPRKRVTRIANEHSYVVKKVVVEHISDLVEDVAKTPKNSAEVESEQVVSVSPKQEVANVGEQSKENAEVISNSNESDCDAKVKRKKKHGEGEDEQDEGKSSKKKHKKKHSDHDSSEDCEYAGSKSPKKKSKKKHAESPEKIEAGKAAERRFKKRLSDLESEIDHCRQFLSQNEQAKENSLEIVDNEIVVSPNSESAIKIRLKRRDSDPGKKRKHKKDKYEVAHLEEEIERSRKRKLSTDEDCEDVIESSQESYAEMASLINTSKRRKLVTSLDVSEEETMVQTVPVDSQGHSTLTEDKIAAIQETETDLKDQDTTQGTTSTSNTTQESLNAEEHIDTVKTANDTQETLTQPTQRTQDTIPDIIADKIEAKGEGCYFELPQKPELTDSEQIMCKMDTMSVCLTSNLDRSSLDEIELRAATPQKQSNAEEPPPTTPSTNSITSSPVTCQTPNRTCELLNDTIDISPISEESNTTTSTCDSVEIPVAKALVFEPKEDTEEKAKCWSFAPPESLLDQDCPADESKDSATSDEPKRTNSGTSHDRASTFANVAHLISPLSHRKFAKRKSGANAVKMSPSTGRIMRLMSNFNKPQVEEKEDGNVREEDLLTFSREVPSPLAVPRSGILKRKLSDSTDSDVMSPASKRKRVNFSDPCLTSKKIFIKDEDFQPSVEAKRLFDVEQQVKPTTLDKLFWQSDSGGSENVETESEQIETDQSLDVASTTILRKDRPIYAKLVDCEDDVIAILKRVTSPMFVTTLMNKLKDRDIKTIGDLAKLSEVEVSRFPFKVPVVANVYKALDNYYYKKMTNKHKDSDGESTKSDDSNKYSETKVCKKTSAISLSGNVTINGYPEKTEEDSSAVTRKEEAVPENTKEPIETAIVNLKQIISQSPMLEKTSSCIIRCLIETIGVSKLIDSVTSMCEREEDRANLTACLSRATSDSRTTSDRTASQTTSDSGSSVYATAKKSYEIAEIKAIVEESVKTGGVSKKEVVDECLLPLVENPRELYGYMDRVTVVELGDVVIDRLENEQVDDFLNRIISTYPEQSLRCLVKISSSILAAPSKMVDTFRSCLGARSEQDQKDIMVDIFRFISGKLDPETLFSLHLEFLSGMRQIVQNNSTSRL